uniref:Protein kinase domain-containing protein n=1 Tax=Lotharella globosa TaxID=91324 RepID=A0A7S3Y9E0_9EUKA
MGAFLTRHRFLEHQEKIKKAIESYKKKKEKKLKHPQNNGNTISATPLPSVYGAEDIDNDGYYTAEEKRRYEMTLEIKQEDESFPEPIRWTRGELIGHGAFGKVYLGMNIESGSLMAVKEIALRPTLKDDEIRNENELLIRDVETEVSMLKDLSHPNIVRYNKKSVERESLDCSHWSHLFQLHRYWSHYGCAFSLHGVCARWQHRGAAQEVCFLFLMLKLNGMPKEVHIICFQVRLFQRAYRSCLHSSNPRRGGASPSVRDHAPRYQRRKHFS